jgi:hypothetical protein
LEELATEDRHGSKPYANARFWELAGTFGGFRVIFLLISMTEGEQA